MSTQIQFAKMHGLGNDFIVVDCVSNPYDIKQLVAASPAMCDRHFGIGGDGVVLVMTSDIADFRMRIINSDGSEAEMCGNGIRCFARFVFEHGLTDKKTFTVETLAGIITPVMHLDGAQISGIRVDMGEPRLERGQIPMYGPDGHVINEPLQVADGTFSLTAVSMGNPHAVTFVPDVDTFPVEKFGPLIERSRAFPKKTNVEFVQVVSPTFLKMRVWERGAGTTLACGTGACATLVAAVLNCLSERTATVELPGGPLEISWDEADNHVYMTGPAEQVFTGAITLV